MPVGNLSEVRTLLEQQQESFIEKNLSNKNEIADIIRKALKIGDGKAKAKEVAMDIAKLSPDGLDYIPTRFISNKEFMAELQGCVGKEESGNYQEKINSISHESSSSSRRTSAGDKKVSRDKVMRVLQRTILDTIHEDGELTVDPRVNEVENPGDELLNILSKSPKIAEVQIVGDNTNDRTR